jgi:hypothetical protein
MKFKKKYLFGAIVLVVIFINLLSTLRLVFAVLYPERMLKEVVIEYFKNNLDKAVKFEDLYIDFSGDIVIQDFNVSITSDFNDNISLVRSDKAVIDLNIFKLVSGAIEVRGIDFYRSDITFLKKYGKSHAECFEQVLGPSRFLKQIKKTGSGFYLHAHRATVIYRETLRDRQVTVELNRVDAAMELDRSYLSYNIDGTIKPYKTMSIRKGSFEISGSVDTGGSEWFSHHVRIDDMDLTYLNEHIAEYKLAGIALEGGASVDLTIGRRKGVVSVKGTCESSNLSVSSTVEKYNLVENENLNCDLDLVIDPDRKSYAARVFNISDDTFTVESSGAYVGNEKSDAIRFRFKTNSIDLGGLSQNFTPYRDIEFGGTLRCEGVLAVDFKNNRADGTNITASLGEFTIRKNEKEGDVTLLDESSLEAKLSDKAMSVDIAARPLNSDIKVKSRTSISNWVPFRSDTKVSASSKKMNVENIWHLLRYCVDTVFDAAYEDKRSGTEKIPFLQKSLGKFLNYNTIDMNCSAATLFFGRKARWSDFFLNAGLDKGAMIIRNLKLDGYGAKYSLGAQAYFNSDQPYVKLDGKIEDFDFGGFYADSGMKGSAGGTARCEFGYEVSVARLGDMLDNSKGSLNIYIGKGAISDTKIQQGIIRFLKKNGYEADALSTINFEDITFSASQQGENFWFSNFAVRGDTLLFGAVGDYMYETGLSSLFSATVRKDAALSVIPLKLSGAILAPCLDIYNKKDSQKACF